MVCFRRLFPAAVTLLVAAFVLASAAAAPASQSKKKKSAPETFNARAKIAAAESAADAYLTIHVDRYTAERDAQAVETALKTGGSTAFLDALRKAPIVGRITAGTQSFSIRWARERPTETGRVITIVTDGPMYFVGGGVPGAKPRAGYDVALVQLKMDDSGIGDGVIAAAARVKPGGPTGVEIDDYAAEPVKLVSVSRVIS